MYALQESVRQMRGTAPAQIPGAKISVCMVWAACSAPPARSSCRTSRCRPLQSAGSRLRAEHSHTHPAELVLVHPHVRLEISGLQGLSPRPVSCEDDQTLEGVVLKALAAREGSLAVVETFSAGQIAARIAHLPGAEKVFRRGLVARDPAEIAATLGLDGGLISGELSRETAEAVARAVRRETGASHALAVLIEVDDGPDRIDFGGSIHLAIAAEEGVESRRSRIYGGRDWVRLGAVELGLDCLRRYLQGARTTICYLLARDGICIAAPDECGADGVRPCFVSN